MPIFGDRKPGRTSPENEPSDLMVSRLPRHSAESDHETPSPPVAEATEQTSGYAQLGEHVGAVLEATKEAAEKMRLQAAEAARQIRADADLKARVTVEEAQKKARQVEAGAALLEAEATERSTKISKEADAYAGTTREAADAQATAVLDRAQRQASERVRATQARLQTLDEHVAATEQRLRQRAAWMRDYASSLEDLVSGSVPSEKQEPAARQTERRSLTDDLTRSVAGQRLSK
jgi:membrane protein involved in colicin uptake